MNQEMIMVTRTRILRMVFSLFVVIFVNSFACRSTAPTTIPKENNSQPVPTTESQGSTSTDPGYSRRSPIPVGTQISIPGWDIEVRDFLRGPDALKVINSADWQASALPEGQEYALAKIFLRCTSTDENAHSLGISELSMTGSSNLTYGDTMDSWPQPEFLFEDMYTAEAVEGWIDAVIPTNEQNLMAVLDVSEGDNRYVRYFALETGASISLQKELSDIKTNDLGAKFDNPAKTGQEVVTSDWAITVLNSIRGQEAGTILEKENPSYSLPEDGMEYLLLQVKLRYISQNDIPASVGSDEFYSVDDKGYMIPSRFIVTPRQSDRVWISNKILPGAELEGWVAVSIPKGSAQPIIAFDPDRNARNSPDTNLRYIQVK
jgi:hypothetical protein